MSESDSARRARMERSRLARRRGAIASAAVVLAAAAALGVGAWRARGSSSASPRGAVIAPNARSATTHSSSKLTKIIAKNPPRPLSHDAPLHVWVGGDSLSGELGPSLGNELATTGIVRTVVDFKVGSGLHDNGLRNWPQRIPSQMSTYSPDVAIFMIGANDASIVGGNESSWAPRYRAKVATVMDLLSGTDHKRTVYWVGPPTMGPSSLNRGAKALNTLMATEARKHPNVVYVDAYAMFSGPDGGYSSHLDLPALHATRVLVRISDGVHFTNSGAEWIAYNVSKLLDEQWQITRQAGGTPLSVTIQSGGGSVPGYRPGRRPTNTYYGTTTTPATAPPSTAAPTTTSGGGPSTTGQPTATTTPKTTPPTTAPHASTTAPHTSTT